MLIAYSLRLERRCVFVDDSVKIGCLALEKVSALPMPTPVFPCHPSAPIRAPAPTPASSWPGPGLVRLVSAGLGAGGLRQ